MNRSYRRTRLRLEPDGCHLFPADPAEGTPGEQDAAVVSGRRVRWVTAWVGEAAWLRAVL
jgi:hypothetical protein